VFENRELGKIFGPKKEEVTRRWRKLHNEELHNFYSRNKGMAITSGGTKLASHVAHVGEKSSVCKMLVTEHEGLKLLGRSRRKWKDNIVT
jgi:hypothetical protein